MELSLIIDHSEPGGGVLLEYVLRTDYTRAEHRRGSVTSAELLYCPTMMGRARGKLIDTKKKV